MLPEWLYTGEVSKFELHRFAIMLDRSEKNNTWRENMVKTIYAEFPKYKEYIEKFTNSGSIFYVSIFKDVLGNLSGYSELYRDMETLRKDIDGLEKKKREIEESINYLENQLEENESKQSALESLINSLETQKDELQKYNANLMSNDGIKKITGYLETVKGLISAIEKTDREKSSTGDILYSDRDRYLSGKEFQQLLELTKMANELENVLKSEDFISIENLDKKRQELKKQMDEVAKSNQTYAKNHLPVIDNKIKEILSSLYDDLEELVPGQMQRGGAQSKVAEAISLLDLSKNRKNNLFRLRKGDPE